MIRPIQVSSEVEFERLLDEVILEANRAADYWNLVRGLDVEFDHFQMEFSQSPVFWSLTFRALYGTVLSYLGRVYDQTGGALSLGSLLMTIKKHPDYFSEKSFRRRLKDNPYVEGLAADMRPLDMSALDAEINRASSNSDHLVKRLQNVRNKVISHRDPQLVRLATLSELSGLTNDEVETLIERATRTANKYTIFYRASSFSEKIIGSEDYTRMLRLLKTGLSAAKRR